MKQIDRVRSSFLHHPLRCDSSSNDDDSGGSPSRQSWVITEISMSMLIECVTLPLLSQATVMNEGVSGQFLATQSVRAWFES